MGDSCRNVIMMPVRLAGEMNGKFKEIDFLQDDNDEEAAGTLSIVRFPDEHQERAPYPLQQTGSMATL